MKNIFTLLLGGLLTSSAFANNITLTLPSNNSYQVLIDGRSVTSDYNSNNTIYLSNLQYGQHSMEVYRMRRGGLFGNKNSLVYSSSFNSSPQYDLNITIDNSGRVQMYQSANNSYGRNSHGNDGYDNTGRVERKKHKDRDGDGDDGGYSKNGNYDNNGGYNNGGYDNRGNNGGYNNRGYNNGYRQPMNDYDFNQLVQRIRGQWIGKLSTARDGISGNYFNTYQVRQILQLFSSQNDRLDLAKASYSNLVDQQNFRQLYDLFSYQSQSELDRYIQTSRY